jgi:hypothetical protein
LWWIEIPQATLDTWQLWHYDAHAARITLIFQAAGDLFRQGNRIVSATLTPILLHVQPDQTNPPRHATLLVDTLDYNTQAPYSGLFRLNLDIGVEGESRGRINGDPQLLLPPGEYRGSLALSSDQARLAFPYYDAAQPSLTAGETLPENTIRLLTLAGRGANTIRPVYAAESQFEFLDPHLAWQNNDRLLAVRSRFAPNGLADLDGATQRVPGPLRDRFGLVAVQLAAPAAVGSQNTTPAVVASHQLPEQRSLKDFASCRNTPNALLIVQDASGNLELDRWDGANPPQPLFGLPANLTRVYLCWQS